MLDSAEGLTKRIQRLFAGSWSLAPEYSKADLSPVFKANGTLNPGTTAYTMAAAGNFRDWRITVGGLVENPFSLSMDDLRAIPFAHPDHAARLRGRLELHRRMDRRAAPAHPRQGRSACRTRAMSSSIAPIR